MFSRASRAARRAERDAAASATEEPSAASSPPPGPYDSGQSPPPARRLDLGSLQVPSVTGVEVRVQTSTEGAVAQVYLLHGQSVLQLGVFAAPRTESIWDEVRDEIRASLLKDALAVEEVAGEYGIELRSRVRTKQGIKDLRFIGVSGPRWLLRAVLQGPAAVDATAATPLLECLRGVVVSRGQEARPAREPLPLRLSEELATQLQTRAASGAGVAEATGVNGTAPPGR